MLDHATNGAGGLVVVDGEAGIGLSVAIGELVQSPAAEAYRVFVVADFEPANVEGVVLVDEADAPAPVDCPVPTPAG